MSVTTEKKPEKTAEQIHQEAVEKMCRQDYGVIYEKLLKAKEDRETLNPQIRRLNENISVCDEALRIKRTNDHLEN